MYYLTREGSAFLNEGSAKRRAKKKAAQSKRDADAAARARAARARVSGLSKQAREVQAALDKRGLSHISVNDPRIHTGVMSTLRANRGGPDCVGEGCKEAVRLHSALSPQEELSKSASREVETGLATGAATRQDKSTTAGATRQKRADKPDYTPREDSSTRYITPTQKLLRFETTKTKGDILQGLERKHFDLILKGRKNSEAAKRLRKAYRLRTESKVGDFFRRLSRNIRQKPGKWTVARSKRASDRAVKQAHKKAKQAEIDAMMAQTDTKHPEVIQNDLERAEFNNSMRDK